MLAPLLAREKEMEANKGLDSSRTTDEWLQIFDILSADNCYAESIYDLQGVSEIMSNVAKIDNLPQTHTKEALLLLRTAWSNIDAYQSARKAYKLIASFHTLLCSS